MRITSGGYIPCITEIKAAAGHLRKLQDAATDSEGMRRSYFDCVFLPESGNFVYNEYPDSRSWTEYNEPYVYIPYECGKGWEETARTPEQIKLQIEAIVYANRKE